MAVNEVQMRYGLLEGQLAHVDDVETGLRCGCVCVACGEQLIAKNAGRVWQHHFSHVYASSNCGGEGWLHATAKLLLAARLRQSLKAHDPVVFEYKCAHRVCHCLHEGDLLRGVETMLLVETRIQETGIQPDIRLEGSKGKFIEIVHTHKPEDPILAFTQFERNPACSDKRRIN